MVSRNTQDAATDGKVPERLLRVLRSLEGGKGGLDYDAAGDALVCRETGKRYDAAQGIPSMMNAGPQAQDWNAWDTDYVQKIGHSYYKRANGDEPEKEASKSYARYLKNKDLYRPGDTLLDLGCATGHFLRSFRRLLDPEIRYTGLDAHLGYLRWGGEIFGVGDQASFVHSDVLDMPFVDNAFDIVVVNLFHFFENPEKALGEAMRVAKRWVVWRTPVAQVNYMVKIVYETDFDKLGVLTPDRSDFDHNVYMLYARKYIEGLAKHLGGRVVHFDRDSDFEDFDNTKMPEFDGLPSTRTFHGLQINGALVLDWHYVAIDCGA